MQNLPIHTQRLEALRIAVERKQRFDSVEELRKIKEMTILSHLIEFQCATAQNILALLEQKNNSILTRMVKDRRIKIARWQNTQVYIPTESGKKWLLQHLDHDDEIQRVRETPIKRKISGYSSEHDILVQNAAIHYATEESAETGANYRIFKPRKKDLEVKIPDAKIVFTKEYTNYRQESIVWVEVERTRKHPVELICSMMRMAYLLYQNPDRVIILCTKQAIYDDYAAALFALRPDCCNMRLPICERINSIIPKYGIGAIIENSDYNDAIEKIDIQLVDENGDQIMDANDDEKALFSPIFWAIAMRQEPNDWRHWAAVAARVIARQTMQEKIGDDETESVSILGEESDTRTMFKDEEISAYQKRLVDVLGAEDSNPMRSAADLARSWQKWTQIRQKINAANLSL